MKHAQAQRGNVFFLVLMGIALFAAFTWAVTKSASQGGSTNPDRDKVDASQIIAYGQSLKQAVDTLRGQGISESDISFANNIVTGYGTVDANPAAEVFNAKGGALGYDKPQTRWLDGVSTAQTGYGEWVFTGANAIRNVGTPIATASFCTGDARCKELVAILPYIKKDICLQINRALDFAESDGSQLPKDNVTFEMTKYTGSFPSSGQVHISSVAAGGRTWGRWQGCVEGDTTPASGTYHYYQVLIAR